MTKEELEPIAEFAKEHDIVVISDEIYSELTYGRDHVSIASLPEMKDRSIVINGFSKAFAMTGWRLGYVAAPRYMMKQMVKVHQFCIMAAPTTSQYAAIEAMRSCDDEVEEMRTAYNQRRRFLVHEFQRIGIECFEPEGAFYIFPSIKKFGMTSEEFATKLLNEEKVAIVPGSAFGACGEGYLRVSYAYSIEELKEAKAKAYKQLKTQASHLTERRIKAAKDAEAQMKEKLIPLGIPNVQFKVELNQRDEPDETGMDRINFLFSANKNGSLQPIAQVASGGEIARVMLSLKAMISGAVKLPTIIFDEIDTGVSGNIAEKMALIMQDMGAHNRQVISITHLPQIAARGANHYKVYKEDNEKGTTSHIIQLDDQQRVEEIAHMLSGATLTDAAINNAKELLHSAH